MNPLGDVGTEDDGVGTRTLRLKEPVTYLVS